MESFLQRVMCGFTISTRDTFVCYCVCFIFLASFFSALQPRLQQ
jgi:hypothetical protein